MKSIISKQQLNALQHIAIIMDGNGRWAKKRGLNRQVGHEQGAKTAENIIEYIYNLGIKYITLYAFSSENWRRPHKEIDAVMSILENYLKKDADELIKNNIKISAIGDLNKLPRGLNKTLKNVMTKTAHCKKLIITLALSYGALEEVIEAVKIITKQIINNREDPNTVNEQMLKKYLCTHDLPDPDLFIRTGGEIRLSNFLLLQASYSELYFTKTLWPDFQKKDLDMAIVNFFNRKRRFGAL